MPRASLSVGQSANDSVRLCLASAFSVQTGRNLAVPAPPPGTGANSSPTLRRDLQSLPRRQPVRGRVARRTFAEDKRPRCRHLRRQHRLPDRKIAGPCSESRDRAAHSASVNGSSREVCFGRCARGNNTHRGIRRRRRPTPTSSAHVSLRVSPSGTPLAWLSAL
jgi:hypothetical protein